MASSDPTLPRIAQYKPFYAELKKGKTYFWCACGLSQNQPYCDGSHKGTEFEPLAYKATENDEEVLFCGCKHSADRPFCDGAHNNLRDEYDTDDPNSAENQSIPWVNRGADGRTRLDGHCFIARVDILDGQRQGDLVVKTIISKAEGAEHQSQFFFSLQKDISPNVGFGEKDVLLFVRNGQGTVNISGQRFELDALSGAHVRPNEVFALERRGHGNFDVYVSVCPAADGPHWFETMPETFDNDYPDRVVAFDEDGRTAMADRFFQILVGKGIGCGSATQFIGEIPKSKATIHRHLYEEALIIVSGSGCMWTRNARTPVSAGDVIFLPRKEGHSLECTSEENMLVAGVIYPGDNPSINY